MKLWAYSGKKIRIVCIDGQKLEGMGYGYTSALDDPDGKASIIIREDSKHGRLIEVYEEEIKKIEILE